MEGNRRIRIRFVIKILIVCRLQVGSIRRLQWGMIFVHSYLTVDCICGCATRIRLNLNFDLSPNQKEDEKDRRSGLRSAHV